jgi:hypothetical protein
MTVLSLVRRPVTVTLDSHPSPAQCENCDSRHIGVCDALLDKDLIFFAGVAQKMSVSAGTLFVEEGDPARFFLQYKFGNGTNI